MSAPPSRSGRGKEWCRSSVHLFLQKNFSEHKGKEKMKERNKKGVGTRHPGIVNAHSNLNVFTDSM